MPTATLSGLPLLSACALMLCPPAPEDDPGHYVVEREHSWAVVRSVETPAQDQEGPATTSIPVAPAAGSVSLGLVGQWAAPMAWDVIAIHAVMLPTGKVLHYSRPTDGPGSRARIWDPETGAFSTVDWTQDVFCSGHSQMPDGRIFVTGGNGSTCSQEGLSVTNLFDPVAETWTPMPDMEDGRWYPTNIMYPDGRTLIFSGLDVACERNRDVELYTPGAGIEVVPEGFRSLALYPRMHLLSDGRIAHVGPEFFTYTFEIGPGWQFVDSFNFGWRYQGTTVLIPGRTDEVLAIGGEVTNTCEIIDFKDPNPQWQYTASLHHARAHADAIILPDKTVLVMGGGRNALYGDPEYVPELFDPETETWTELPPHTWPRSYHATTVLIPDGRVLVAGQDNGGGAWTAELYSPPYLFRGARPTIDDAPTAVLNGQTFTVNATPAGTVDSVVLVRLSSVTHSVNFEQRLLDLSFTVNPAVDGDAVTIEATAPANEYEAIPGFYYLFVVNASGVPSVAKIVQVSVPATGDVDLDGDVDFADLLAVVAQWGECGPGPCAGDVNGDGTVGFADVLVVIGNWS